MINLKNVAADPRIVRLAMLLSQYTPERIGHQVILVGSQHRLPAQTCCVPRCRVQSWTGVGDN